MDFLSSSKLAEVEQKLSEGRKLHYDEVEKLQSKIDALKYELGVEKEHNDRLKEKIEAEKALHKETIRDFKEGYDVAFETLKHLGLEHIWD